MLLVLAYQLRPQPRDADLVSPEILEAGVFPMIDCILARDRRLAMRGGRWFGPFGTPAVLSKIGRAGDAAGRRLDTDNYGRKESEGKDFNEDTNFGKLKRVPYPPLQAFLKKYRGA